MVSNKKIIAYFRPNIFLGFSRYILAFVSISKHSNTNLKIVLGVCFDFFMIDFFSDERPLIKTFSANRKITNECIAFFIK